MARDLWGKPIGWLLVPTPNGEAEVPWDSSLCAGPCWVEIERELTEEEFKEVWQQTRLSRIADSVAGPRLAR